MSKFLLIIAIFSTNIFANHLIISYRGVYQNHQVLNESFMVTNAMIRHQESKIKASFNLDIEADQLDISVAKFLRENQDRVIEELFKNGILLTDQTDSHKSNLRGKTVITLPSTKVIVTIYGKLAKITILE